MQKYILKYGMTVLSTLSIILAVRNIIRLAINSPYDQRRTIYSYITSATSIINSGSWIVLEWLKK